MHVCNIRDAPSHKWAAFKLTLSTPNIYGSAVAVLDKTLWGTGPPSAEWEVGNNK